MTTNIETLPQEGVVGDLFHREHGVRVQAGCEPDGSTAYVLVESRYRSLGAQSATLIVKNPAELREAAAVFTAAADAMDHHRAKAKA